MKRNSNVIKVGKGYRLFNNRMEWVTYENVGKMYNLVYEQMVRSGVTKHLAPDDYYYLNKDGEKVDSKEESVGLQVKVMLPLLSRSYSAMKWEQNNVGGQKNCGVKRNKSKYKK